jgi:hypothetical protein
MMHVEMSVHVNDGTIIMPVGLPGYKTSCTDNERGIGPCAVIGVPELQLQLRVQEPGMGEAYFVSDIYQAKRW